MIGRLSRITAVCAIAIAGVLAASGHASATVIYDNIATPQPGNVPSTGLEATQASELGDQVQLAGTNRQNPKVSVLMSSWGCEDGAWFSNDCSTSTGSSFTEPITLNLYNVGAGNTVGTLIKSVTQTFTIPYRPSKNTTNCTGASAGEWFDGTECLNGLAVPITFNLAGQGVTLPNNVIVSVAYNTSHAGYAPIGEAACFSQSGGCGYDSLNVGDENATASGPATGSYADPDDAYFNSQTAGQYCDGGAGGTGTFRRDPGAGCWTGFQPSFRISASASSDVVVNDNTVGPGPAGADCANPDFSNIHDAVNASVAGSTILVCAGTYNETVNVNKKLTIEGAQAGVDARTRSVPASSESTVTGGGIGVVADGVTLDGFTVQNVGPSPFGTGIFLSGSNSGQRIVNNIVRNNIFGLYLNNAPDQQTTVRHNLFDSNNASGPAGGNGIYGDAGIQNVVVDQNRETNQDNAGILLTTSGAPVSNVKITGNQLSDRIRITKGQDLTVSGNTITGSPNNGVQLDSDNRNVTVSGNTITGSALGAVRFSSFDIPSDGPSENVTVSGNTLTGNAYGVVVNDSGGDQAYNGVLEVHFNRIAGNTTNGVALNDDADVNAQNNWWGCNAGPGNPGCDSVGGDFAGQITSSPRLVLGISAVPSTIFAGTGQSQLTADLTHNSVGAVAGAGFPDGTSVAFGATPLGTVNPASAATVSGTAGSVLSAGATTGTTNARATLDSQTVATPVTIATPPQGQQGQSGGVAGAVGKSRKCKKKRSRKAVAAKKCKRKKK